MSTVDSVCHDFLERLEYSAKLSDEAGWVEFYKRLWPDLISAVRLDKDSKWQRWGVDRILFLESGRQLSIDEKKREKDYGDVLIEEWSVGHKLPNGDFKGQKIGWSLDRTKRCDFIAYAIPSASKCYLLPFELLRITCEHNLEEWKKLRNKQGYATYPKDAPNNGYLTRNCAVDWCELKRAMSEQMLRRFGSAQELPLPSLDCTGKQLNFDWT